MKTTGFLLPLLLALVTFLVYGPSLKSDFVYDAQLEILEEGFITSPSNLPDVLSLKVLGMPLLLGSRPGQLLYLMLIASICGKTPFGYHLCSNLLHAANVALLFILLRRLIAAEFTGLTADGAGKANWAAVVVTLIFALHPIAVEPVAEISYSSSLLVTLFTLLALLAATAFRPDQLRSTLSMGSAGTLCALAAVMSKESGIAAALSLVVYWYVFRRAEPRQPWFLFLGSSILVTALFLVARFYLAPPSPTHFDYLGGSIYQVFLIQPHLWVYMMGKLIWPLSLSADYTPENSDGVPLVVGYAVLAAVVLAQDWLANRSRIGALGVALYWLGLLTVSNFIPLYRALADRFYYLPLAGVAMQLLALLLILQKSSQAYRALLILLLVALIPLTFLTFQRQQVFANTIALWTDTVRVSPTSSTALAGYGLILYQRGQVDEAILEYEKALKITPNTVKPLNNYGVALLHQGRIEEASAVFRHAISLDPRMAAAQANLGAALARQGQVEEAILHLQEALRLDPDNLEARQNLATEEARLHQPATEKQSPTP